MTGQIIAAILIAAVVGGIGLALIREGDNWVGRLLGILLMNVAGGILAIGLGLPAYAGWTQTDHDKCQSYQWLDESWKCVPWEEAG